MLPFVPGIEFAQQLDQQDELASFRADFLISDPEMLYLDGNSLGRPSRQAVEAMYEAIQHQWGESLIRSWGDGWYSAPQRLGDKIGRLVGAAPGQVIASDSTSVNLYKLTMAALSLRPERSKIITDTYNFPTDIYILQGCIHTLAGRFTLYLVDPDAAPDSGDDADASRDADARGDTAGFRDPSQAIMAAIDENTALVTLSHVVFKSGYLYDAAAITRRAHEMGALVLWDLSHAAGAVPVALDEWGVDFAVGCTYKYLNGGPGAPAFLYVRSDLQNRTVSPIWGWFSEASPFAFDLTYHPSHGVTRFLCGTPPVISLLGIESGVDLLLEAGIDRLREKSVAQTEYLIRLFDYSLASLGFVLGSPRDPARRGSHVSLRHPEGYRINRALIEQMNVIPDFREPDNVRLGIAPIYTRYIDIWETVQRLITVVKEERYKKYPLDRLSVT